MWWHQTWKQNWEVYFKSSRKILPQELAYHKWATNNHQHRWQQTMQLQTASSMERKNKKISWATDMRIYWVRDRIRQNHFHIFWEEGKKNLLDYVTTHHPLCNQRTMRPRYVKASQKDTENAKDRWTETWRGCDVTTNNGGTWKVDNPLKGMRNSIPRNLDNHRKGIRELVSNGIRSQWPRGSTVTT